MKILHNPFWGNIFAGIILLILSSALSAAFHYIKAPELLKDWQNSTIEINSIALLSFLLFGVMLALVSFWIHSYKKYDVFISAPMSFDTDEEYQTFRKLCLEVKESLESCGFNHVYYAGEHYESMQDFDFNQQAAIDDLKALKLSKKLLFIYPQKMVSSSIFEVGYAYRKKLPSVYFYQNTADLPFLMQHLDGTSKSVSQYECETIQNIPKYIRKDGCKLFI